MTIDPEVRLRFPHADGTVTEVEVTPAQALDLNAGQRLAYAPHDERLLIDEDGTLVYRESARPVEDAA